MDDDGEQSFAAAAETAAAAPAAKGCHGPGPAAARQCAVVGRELRLETSETPRCLQ